MVSFFEGELPLEFKSSIFEDIHEGLHEYSGQTGSEYVKEIPWSSSSQPEKYNMYEENLGNPDQEIDDNSAFMYKQGLFPDYINETITTRPDYEILDDPTVGPIGHYMDIFEESRKQYKMETESHYARLQQNLSSNPIPSVPEQSMIHMGPHDMAQDSQFRSQVMARPVVEVHEYKEQGRVENGSFVNKYNKESRHTSFIDSEWILQKLGL